MKKSVIWSQLWLNFDLKKKINFEESPMEKALMN